MHRHTQHTAHTLTTQVEFSSEKTASVRIIDFVHIKLKCFKFVKSIAALQRRPDTHSLPAYSRLLACWMSQNISVDGIRPDY